MPIIEVNPNEPRKPQDLKVNPELKKLIPRLGSKEQEQLESNILSEGCRYPIVYWNGYIVDGHHRYKICKKHNIDFQTIPLIPHPETEEEVKIWMIRNALGTRTLTTYQQTELARNLDEFAFRSRQGKRTDLEKQQEEQKLKKYWSKIYKPRRKKLRELWNKETLTRDEKFEKRRLETDFGHPNSKERLQELKNKETLDPDEEEEKDFLDDFFSNLRGEIQTLKNKNKHSSSDRSRIGVLNKYLFGPVEAEEIKEAECEKRLQELQDKETLNSREEKEKENLLKSVYNYRTSKQTCAEVRKNNDNSIENLKKPSEKTADALGIGSRTLSKSRYIEKHADENLKQELREGKKSIDGAYRKIKAQKWDYIGCFPKHDYRVFYADFWPTYLPDFGIRSITDIKNLPIKEFPNKLGAVCFLWSPLQKLDVTISVLNAWGFSYRTLFTLETDRKYKGTYNSIDSLSIVVGIYKHDCEPDTKKLISSTLNKSIAGKNRVEEFRKIIDQMYTSGNKIQLFSDKATSTWDAILS